MLELAAAAKWTKSIIRSEILTVRAPPIYTVHHPAHQRQLLGEEGRAASTIQTLVPKPVMNKTAVMHGIFSQQTFFSATKHVLRRLIQHTKWHCYKQADSTHQMALLGLQKVYKEPNFAM
ncbi:hypothetical protein F4604DRAFT_1674161 [Suillus subluteus]|nr:hypothetical protein F4604DRAFT_1674161 [Suillus subluteus]